MKFAGKVCSRGEVPQSPVGVAQLRRLQTGNRFLPE